MLDTNVVIHVLKGNPNAVRNFGENAGDIALPAMVLGELLFGVANSKNPIKNAKLLDALIDSLPVLHTNDAIMRTFAEQKAALSSIGEAVGDADTLIAATAIVYDATLVTGNIRHFSRFDGLRVDDWSV